MYDQSYMGHAWITIHWFFLVYLRVIHPFALLSLEAASTSTFQTPTTTNSNNLYVVQRTPPISIY